jgi:C4-dicarboxylate transporter
MDITVENKKKSNLLLVIAIIVAAVLVIWVIALFDKMDNPGNTERSTNKLIEQTITKNQSFKVYDLLQIDKNYT